MSAFPKEMNNPIQLNKKVEDDEAEDQREIIYESKFMAKKIRRILKQKQKVLQEFARLSQVRTNKKNLKSRGLCNNSSEQSLVNLRRCSVYVPRSIFNSKEFNFLFDGFIRIEISSSASQSEWYPKNRDYNILKDSFGLHIGKIERCSDTTFYSSVDTMDFSITNTFDTAVYVLENSQNLESYLLAQNLKKYEQIVEEHRKLILRVSKEIYAARPEELLELEAKRRIYRQNVVTAFIEKTMTEDDFFMSCDGSIHFFDGLVYPSKFQFSRNIFALLGIDEANIESAILRRDIFSALIPMHSRQRLIQACLEMRVKSSESQWKVSLKDFEINTLDSISILCEASTEEYVIEFPSELSFVGELEQLNRKEIFQFVKLEITLGHLEKVISQRNGIKASRDESIRVEELSEDFEYSIMSSIFLEKFYAKEFKKFTSSGTGNGNGNDGEINEELEEYQQRKVCRYKFIELN